MAQGQIAPQPRRALSERRQRRAQHADPVHRSRSTTRGGRRIAMPAANVLQIGSDSAGVALGSASAADRPALDLQRRPAGDRPADRLSELEPLALPGHRHLVHRRPVVAPGHRAGSDAISTAAVAGRSADRLVHRARDAADAAGAHGRRAGDPQRAALRVRQPERRQPTRSSRGRARCASRRTSRSISRTWRSSTRRRRRRSRRSIASAQVARVRADGDLSEQRARARRCAPSPARWRTTSARACSGCRPAASTRTPGRAPTRRTAPTPT